jgi:hypothetical protein
MTAFHAALPNGKSRRCGNIRASSARSMKIQFTGWAPLRLQIAMTAPKTSMPADAYNRLESNEFPDITNGGFQRHSTDRCAALALGGCEPTPTTFCNSTNDGFYLDLSKLVG